ncbi:MAG TPA: hypothetical protein ENN99_16765 [Chloroflexi bacterium]|nr:hypothetical protein [Chloroflexota bacterium]
MRWRWQNWTGVILGILLLTAAYSRFTGLNWDEGEWIHPDEGHMRMITSVIRMPDSPSLYFDTHNSPLNCRNSGYQYSYGTLPLFLTRMMAEWLDQGCGESAGGLNAAVVSMLFGSAPFDAPLCTPGTFTGAHSALVGRMFSALADLGSVLLIYLIGRQLYGEGVGLLGATLGAVTAFLIQQAHFFTVDSMACFFVTLTAYFSIRAGQRGRWADFALAGFSTGLAAACKVDGALAALLVALAGGWRWWALTRPCSSADRSDAEPSSPVSASTILLYLVLAGLLAGVAFRIAQPYAFEGPGFLGIKPSPEWFGRLSQIRVEQSGEADLPWGRQWTDRTPILFPWVNMVVWGMGLPLGLAAWAGWALIGLELARGKRRHLVLWVWVTVIFFYQATRWVKAMRYSLSLYPMFIVFAAYMLSRLLQTAGRPRLARWARAALVAIVGLVVVGTALWGSAVFSIYLRAHTRVAASRWIYAKVPEGVMVANEHYDWGLPLRLDGHNPFGGMYQGIEMQLYNEDTPEKRAQLYSWLDQADYIFLASNRLYASIPRLAARYPLTIEYYRALFAGELGFELAADFTSRPAIGPFQFPDQENPFPLMAPTDYLYQTNPIQVRLPPAEEAFSVYDHPRVLIFRKTEAYSPRLVREVLGVVDLERVLNGLSPWQATAAPDLLEFDADTWADQQAGGTWAEMFDRESLSNRYPGVAVVAWWVVVTLLGWVTFPLLFVALPRLRDRGYGAARMLGLLIIAYLTWIVASAQVLPNTRSTIVRMVLLLTVVGGGVGWLRRAEMRQFVQRRWRLILAVEGLFVGLYLAWVGVRLLHPDLWHPAMGGEKPMDVAYLNAVIKSTWFPPYNPWFSGTKINYYYYGFVIVGTLIKLMGTVPAVAYNLALPLLVALTGVGAFSVAYNLFGGCRRGAWLAGGAALAFTVLLGNLGVVHLVRNALVALGGESFPSTIPIFADTVLTLRGIWEIVAHGASLPIRIESWYWHPTRIIPGETGNPIAEFPAFTFLYGDLHAHMIALPITLLALLLAVYWARTRWPQWSSLLMGGLVIGALWPTNTWDYPTYLVVSLAALVVAVASQARVRGSDLEGATWRALALIILTRLLYQPYFHHYAAGYSSVKRWEDGQTPLTIYLWIHGLFLFPIVTRLAVEVHRLRCRHTQYTRYLYGALGISVLTGLILFLLGHQIALLTLPVGVCVAGLVCAPEMPAGRRLLWLLVGAGMALSLLVEVVVLKGDIGRMNTVFKFYLQVWVMLAVAAGVSLAWVRERAFRWRIEGRQLWWIGMGLLVFGGALFLPYGIRSRAVDRISSYTGPTLDGMAFMQTSTVSDGPPGEPLREISLRGDYFAIRWMQDHIQGSPVIMEGLGYREYLWANRVSIYTGLPAVVGWRWHQVQQRTVLPDVMVNWRRDDVTRCYSTTDAAAAQEILTRYGVRYVYVGEYEGAYYSQAGLTKFDALAAQGWLRVVYDQYGVRIYEVLGWDE